MLCFDSLKRKIKMCYDCVKNWTNISGFVNEIYFKKENLNLLFINLLLMIQFYIPWEGEGGYDENMK